MVSPKGIFFATQFVFQYFIFLFITCFIWLCGYSLSWNNLHTWHVFFSTIGFSFFMGEAIALLNPASADLLKVDRNKRHTWHGLLMFCAAICVIVGVSLKMQDKIDNNRGHFTTTHGILGFTAFIITLVATLGGILARFARNLYDACGISPRIITSCHMFLGVCGYIIGIVCLCYGLNDYFALVDSPTQTAFIVIVAIGAFFNILSPLKRLFRL